MAGAKILGTLKMPYSAENIRYLLIIQMPLFILMRMNPL